ncbi:MAG: tetratricopeptide repeat protein [Leptospirales bacterium]
MKRWTVSVLWILILTSGIGTAIGSEADPQSGTLSQQMRERIQIDLRLGDTPKALSLVRRYVVDYPKDRRGYFLKARVFEIIGKGHHALQVINHGLTFFPHDNDLLYLKASIYMEEKKFDLARPILMQLYQHNPNDTGIRSDLIQTYEGTGVLRPDQNISTNFFLGTATQPPPGPSVQLLSNLSDWSLSSNVYSMLYPGGTSLVVDTRTTTPLVGKNHFFVGQTEYLGFSQAFGNGTNAFTYAGTDWILGPGTHLTLEAGDTRLRSPGLYGRLNSVQGPLSFSLQGFGNMIWGDYGESIVQNGLESGMIASAAWQVLPRLSVSADYWYFDYTLENGSIPFGNLHNADGMFDVTLSRTPNVDLIGGYDSWTVLAPPASAARVPILLEQRYFLVGVSFEKQYESLWTLTGELGGYDDIYLNLASYETSAGIAYRLGSRWQFYTNAYYFNQSTVVSGSTESFMGGFKFWF